jgi:glyoxylase-like metal-dependent hydrolase (beta-lactamase superfamily II)
MEIIPNVHRIPGMRGANVYLLLSSSLTLVDTGMPGSEETILAYIEGLGFRRTDLTRIVITHSHLDHVGGLAALKQRTSARVLAHADEAPSISGKGDALLPQSGVVRLFLRLVGRLMPHAEPAAVDVALHDGDHLDLLGGAEVVHVPGHTPGAIALYLPSERLLICGDVIDHRGGKVGLPPKLFSVDMEQAIDSVRRLAELEFDVLCPGHGEPIVGGADEQLRAMLRERA